MTLDASSDATIVEGAVRQPPEFSISARSDEKGEWSYFTVLTSWQPSGPGNRDAGIALDQGRIPLSFLAAFRPRDMLRPSVKMGFLADGSLEGNVSMDTWRIVGVAWPRDSEVAAFHQGLYAMYAKLKDQ
ncbi:MAG TPA: hypothetical protein VMT18_00250 [Planctomycetota bacterium]|nr:hypothetical protein [Planctomycetota bacterium]